MKKIYYLFTLVTVLFAACKKDATAPEKEVTNPDGALTLFVDTFRVYSSDLQGNGLKAVIDEDEKSGNNYIAEIAHSQNNKFVYAYVPSTGNRDMQIKIANADGSGKKVLKTMATNVSIDNLYSFGGKIFYYTNSNSSGTYVNELRSMNEDGSNDIKENLPRPSMMAKNGSAYISTSTDYTSTTPSTSYYVARFKDGKWDEAGSFKLPKITDLVRAEAISTDGNTLIYATTATYEATTYDIYTVDISKKGNTAKKITSYTIPATGEGAMAYPMLSAAFTNNNANVLVGYGVNVDNKRYATKNDYYYVINIDVEKGNIAKKWKITGEYGGFLVSN